jgi:hypothetical protein
MIWYIFLAASYPALVNITKHYVSDLLAYSNIYVEYSHASFSDFFQSFNTDFLYNFINLISSKVI